MPFDERKPLLLQLEDVDADDLLSFLDPPPDLSTPPSSSSGMSGTCGTGAGGQGQAGSDASGRTPTQSGTGQSGMTPNAYTEGSSSYHDSRTPDDVLNGLIGDYE